MRGAPTSTGGDPILDAEKERLAAVRRYAVLDTPPDGAFDRVTALAAQFFNVSIALVTIVDEDRIWFKSRYGLDDVSEIPRDPGLCASAICRDEPYIVERALEDPRTLANPLVAGEFGLRFYAAVPLKTVDGFNLGTLCIIDRAPREMRRREEIEALETFAKIVTDQLEIRLAAIRTVAAERAVYRHVADTLQRALLPESMPAIANVEIDAVYQAAATEAAVGGDWYDAFALNGREIVLSIGDVEGHGLESAVVMGKVRHALRSLAYKESSPFGLLRDLDAFLRRENPHVMVTAFIALLDAATGTLSYANAGHPPPFLRRANGEIGTLEIGGLPLGMREADEPAQRRIILTSGDLLVLYTDGLTESTRDLTAGEQRVRDRLGAADMTADATPAQSLASSIIPNGSHDDAAILAVRFTGRSA
jgi:sigma-B regulation protein RsbU (phosphoserine phosphatase)